MAASYTSLAAIEKIIEHLQQAEFANRFGYECVTALHSERETLARIIDNVQNDAIKAQQSFSDGIRKATE